MSKMNLDLSINELVDDLNESSPDSVTTISESDNIPQRWQPKEWNVRYEQVVMMDMMGLKGYEIAEKMGYTPQHVYNILGCDEAIAIQKALVGRVRKEGVNISEELDEIQRLTVRRLKTSLKDNDSFEKSPLGFIRAGIDVMKGMGEYLKNSPTEQITNNFTLPPSVADKFLAGLEKSDEARRLLLEGTKREIAVVESDG